MNRYSDILPCNLFLKIDHHTMVTLESGSGIWAEKYVNANYIHHPFNGNQKEFIASQAPVPASMVNFWKMIWEQTIMTIVMLCGIQEHGRINCHVYWPDPTLSKPVVKHGDFEIKYLDTDTTNEFYWVRKFEIKVELVLFRIQKLKKQDLWINSMYIFCYIRVLDGLIGKYPQHNTLNHSSTW